MRGLWGTEEMIEVQVLKPRMTIRQVSLIMVLTSVVAPVMVYPFTSWTYDGVQVEHYQVYAMVWYYGAIYGGYGEYSVGIRLFDPLMMISTTPVTLPVLLFALAVVRYCQGRWHTAKLLAMGVVSIIIPLMAGISYMVYFATVSSFAYAGPVPIHFIVGAVLIKIARTRPVAPWEDSAETEPWWVEEGY